MRRAVSLLLALSLLAVPSEAPAKTRKKAPVPKKPALTAQAYAVVDIEDGSILHGKMPNKRLPPASTTKVMTVLVAMEFLPLEYPVTVGPNAANISPSKAGLTPGARYKAIDLVKACLVASSNDAAVALAEAIAGSEKAFAGLMNERAKKLGMNDTKFINSTGLTEKGRAQYTTALDLTRMMRVAVKDRRIDEMMALIETSIRGSDGKVLPLRAHNKMLWKAPKSVKGKTGWTYASRHTFVGTDYARHKFIVFALLSSKKPWTDIQLLSSFGGLLARRR